MLYTSPVVPSNSSATRTVCIPKTTYDTYDLKFSSPEWHHDSNVFFKGSYGQHLYASPWDAVTFNLILYTPIKKNSDWIVCLTGRSSHWTDLDWSSTGGVEKPADEIAGYVNYMRIFVRKVIEIPSILQTAYEIRIKYKDGIVIYVNGAEAFRDNMKNGVIKQDALPTNTYTTYDYRGTIRTASELGTGSCVIAVELHGSERITSFDGWLSLYGSSWGKTDEYRVYYYPVNETLIFGEVGYDIPCDFNHYSTLYTSELMSGLYFDFDIGNGQCNGFMYYVGADWGKMKDVQVKGYLKRTNEWLPILERSLTVQSDEENAYGGLLYMNSIQKLRIYINSVERFPVGWSEIRPILIDLQIGRDTPDVHDVLLEYKTNEIVQEIVYNSYYFMCDNLSAFPKGLTITDKCILVGQPTEIGSYQINLIVTDFYGPRYSTVFISISEGEPVNDNIYDTSYTTGSKVLATILIIIVIILMIVGIFFVLKPEKKTKQLPKVHPDSIKVTPNGTSSIDSSLGVSMSSTAVNQIPSMSFLNTTLSPEMGVIPMISSPSSSSQPIYVIPSPGHAGVPAGVPIGSPAVGVPAGVPIGSPAGVPAVLPVPAGVPIGSPAVGVPIGSPAGAPAVLPIPSRIPAILPLPSNVPKNPPHK